MVFYSEVSIANLSEILIGLITWQKHPLSVDHAEKYVTEIRIVCDALDSKIFHFNTQFTLHKSYGNKVHTHRKSKQTSWYIFTIWIGMEMFIYNAYCRIIQLPTTKFKG